MHLSEPIRLVAGSAREARERVFMCTYGWSGASLGAQTVKKPPAMQETHVRSLGRKFPWRRELLPTPVILPGEFHGQRNLVGHSPWVTESRTPQRLTNR